ncbi:MAG: fibronectin type III domain-containing protein [Meiothermus sp.]|nr:fibronectin type III domain-containing protein [Meiothermus sp.]
MFGLLLLLAACGGGQDLAPAVPSGLKATPADRSVRLEWNPNTESDLKGYLVNVTLADGVLVSNNPVSAPASQFTVEGLSNGTAYMFRVLAEDQAGNRSAFSASLSAAAGQPSTPPARPTGLSASAQSEQVLLTWVKNPEADLKGYTLLYGDSPASLPQRRNLSASAQSTVVSGLANGTAYYFALEAENTAGQKSPRTEVVSAVPQANLSAPVISSYAISGYGTSTQVRQGAGGIEVTLQGQRLDTLTSARLLGAFDFTILEKTATTARLTGVVPHGLLPGPYALLALSGAGETAVADAIEITKITAAKTSQLNPSDTTGLGTPNRPFLTLTRALSAAGAGDTVLLGVGIYKDGENWPTSTSAPNVPAGVSLEGQSNDRGAVLLERPTSQADRVGLKFTGSGSVRNLTVRGFTGGIWLRAGTLANRAGELEVENIAAIENTVGVWLENAQRFTLSRSSLATNTQEGLLAASTGQIALSQSEWFGNGVGIRLTNASALASSATLSQLSVSESGNDGIYSLNVSVDLSNTRSFRNRNNGHGLVLVGRPGFVALRAGTVLEQNDGVQLLDAREASQGTFNATRYLLPGSDITVGAVVGPVTRGNFLSITRSGNAILFQ